MSKLPFFKDASASAYQIMSYFLLDESMAKRTNLIPSDDGQIQDVYEFFREELVKFIKEEIYDENSSLYQNSSLYNVVRDYLTRDAVKGLFMPKIYGKTIRSTSEDLSNILSQVINKKEGYILAATCFKFWRERFSGMECLIRLIRHIGWIASSLDHSVLYKVPYFTTLQDYIKMVPISIWVYDSTHKRRKVTMRVSSFKRDRRKTDISTFVNFIHQKDAHIAMQVVEKLLSQNYPIYTVHDNFISTACASQFIPDYYTDVIRKMGPPLKIINEFLYMNIIQFHPFVSSGEKQHRGNISNYWSDKVIPTQDLRKFL